MQLIWAASKHYLIHLALAIFVSIILILIGVELSFILFIFATFLIDVDHIINLFDQRDPTSKKIWEIIKSDKDTLEKILDAVKVLNEEGFHKLIFHNFPALAFVLVVVIFHFKNALLLSFFGAFLVHQLFDLVWDYVRWRKFDHWLWKESSDQSSVVGFQN